jgi:hypothetical protein
MENSPQNSNKVFKDFLKTFIVPVLINKVFMLYFGLNYSNHPGEGYGYGLAATVVVLLLACGLFIWKYRNVEDP